MKSIYHPDDDILYLKFNHKPIVREVSCDWHVNIAYAEDGDLAEITVLDAQATGLYPVLTEQRRAA
ncbi:DUF2283 domain-containing protein [Candidatus Methylospira mobilis]|uniref:DUF2283 domain-containing protein n=1 Tax=Candidatus Methylospira mobilis TaxID=1808979 RepID=UPI0028E7F2BF|nr:DUF2283 domain-containing protein [Candidatus Methylospira mobilis]WNV06138.1 DUF2283 domain-containing protein [Candidatus Methylospira mobilis]